jgi:hypothetical protein
LLSILLEQILQLLPGSLATISGLRMTRLTTFVVNIEKENSVSMRGGGFGSVKGISVRNINQSNVRLEDQVALNGIIPMP